MRDDRDVNEARYIVLLPSRAFTVYYEEKLFSGDFGNLSLPLLERANYEAVKQAVLCYENVENYATFEEEIMRDDPEASIYRLKKAQLERLKETLE